MLTDEQKKIFRDATERRLTMERMRRENQTDAGKLNVMLRGARIRKGSMVYEIADIRSDYSGGFSVRAYRIVANGKRGTKIWDAGALYPTCFGD